MRDVTMPPVQRPLALMGAMLIIVAAVFAGGCGGGDDSDDEADAAAPTAGRTIESSEETPARSADAETIDIGQTFWHAGWKVTLNEATIVPASSGGTVEFDATFENLSTAQASFNSQVVIVTDEDSYAETGINNDFPTVAGGQKSSGTIAIVVDGAFSFDGATLVIGNAENNQAKVPLGSGGEDLVTLEPVEIPVTGQVVAGALTIDVEGVEVRSDVPDTHDEIEAGYKLVIVRFRATPGTGIQIGQGVLQSDAVALKLPDGTSVSVRQDGRSGVNELLQGREGTTIRDLAVRFEVPEPLAGTFAFLVQGAYGPGGARVSGELPFQIDLDAVNAGTTPVAGATAASTAGAPSQP